MSADKKRFKKFIIGLLLCFLALVIHPLWLPLPAKFLMVRDNIKKADALVMLSGDWNFGREAKSIELYKSGFASKIIRVLEKENRGFEIIKGLLNSDATQKEIYLRYFDMRGIPRDLVILGDTTITSTFGELKVVREIALKNNFKSIIIVTSDYHMRRALMTAKWLFKSDDITIYNAAVYSNNFHPNRWWLYEEDIRGVIFEYLSLCLYICYHFATGK